MKTIDENSNFRVAWDFFILLLIIVSCVLIPFQLAFRHAALSLGSWVVYIIDVVFWVDIGLNFLTSFRSHGLKVTGARETTLHYLKSVCIVDIAANLPLDALFLYGPDIRMAGLSLVLVLRQLRLLRLVRLFVIFRRWQDLSWTNSGYLRIAKFFTTVMLLIHWIACAWFLVPYIEGFPENCWVVQQGIEHAGPATQYIRALYWVIQTMATVGYGDITPHRDFEYAFSILIMLLGASTYAFIVGNIASLFSNLDAARADYFNKIEATSQYLHSRQVPHQLNEQVRDYYEYIWDRRRGFKEEALFEDLPPSFRLSLLQLLARDLIERVPLFKHCSPILRNLLLLALKPQTYAPGVYIAREGEIGREIYFISRGTVEIISDAGGENYGRLGDGDYFGDLTLILKEKRSASVKALTYCDVYILTKKDFNRIRSEYPEFKSVLKKVSSEKTEKVVNLLLKGVTL
ncbi:MAG: ion transporter [Deltaproteobacteria bacterium]|nr:ion transporter [Deltaproteobacteria bacterium]